MRYTELDGLRGVAALSVYFSHLVGVFNFDSIGFSMVSNSPLHILWHGEAAVMLFFMLSGFVLTLPYIKHRDNLNLRPFYIKRVFRIYPAFLFVILISVFMKEFFFNPKSMLLFSDWINEFWQWNLNDISLSEWFNTIVLVGLPFDKKIFVPVIGTLRKEMIMSVFLPFLIFIALRFKSGINILLLALLCYFEKNVCFMFYIGIMMAIYKDNILGYQRKINSNILTFSILIIAVFLYTSRYSLFYWVKLPSWLMPYMTIIGCALFLVYSLKSGFFNTFFKLKIIQFLGKISYSLYLIHFPILLLTCSFVSNYLKSDSSILIFLISISITLLFSNLIYKYIEIPCIRLGRKLTDYYFPICTSIFSKKYRIVKMFRN